LALRGLVELLQEEVELLVLRLKKTCDVLSKAKCAEVEEMPSRALRIGGPWEKAS
jgi:hypothetical protein